MVIELLLLAFVIILCCTQIIVDGWTWSSSSPFSRRHWFQESLAVLGGTATTIVVSPLVQPSHAETNGDYNELPLVLRDFTKLAPLGNANTNAKDNDSTTTTTTTTTTKTMNLSLTELASRLKVDLTVGHSETGQKGYFISGDLDESIFRDDCVFVDPTNRVASLSQYRNALLILFDPSESQVELVRPISVNEQARTLHATIRSRGVLQLPWRPYITAYESNIVYTIDENGLIAEQSQTWSKSATRALQESFFPALNRPAPKSTLRSTLAEPPLVTKLFHYVNGRRPYEYTPQERLEISQLIDRIVKEEESLSNNKQFRPEWFPGTWMLAYLQPGPTGVGIDRRIPFFPDFDWNDNFQIFSPTTVVNIGQVLGPLLQVQVQGNLVEEDPTSRQVPKRFKAQINRGDICWGATTSSSGSVCLGLPISGEGLFDSVYLGERLRIGQNINGGGARVVQVKLE